MSPALRSFYQDNPSHDWKLCPTEDAVECARCRRKVHGADIAFHRICLAPCPGDTYRLHPLPDGAK